VVKAYQSLSDNVQIPCVHYTQGRGRFNNYPSVKCHSSTIDLLDKATK